MPSSNVSHQFSYCDKYHLSDVWVHSGLTHCFYDTAFTSILLFMAVILGSVQWIFYSKYSATISLKYRPKTSWYTVQCTLMFALSFEGIVYIIIMDTVASPFLYGYQIYRGLGVIVTWLFAVWLIHLERTRIIPTVKSKGHGLVLLSFWTLAFIREALAFVSWSSPEWWWFLNGAGDVSLFTLWVIRFVFTLTLFIVGIAAPSVPSLREYYSLIDDEEAPSPRNSPSADSTWANVTKKIRLMMPYIWPKGSPLLQVVALFCVLLLATGRVVNVFVPLYNKKIVDSLTITRGTVKNGALVFRWDLICIWILLKLFQGGGMGSSGMLNNLRQLIWIKVQQYTTRTIQVKLFSHLHDLSLRWHLSKKTGEVLRIVDRGTNSVNTLLSYILFNVFPTIADIVIAIVYFVTTYDYIFGIIVFMTMIFYLFFTIVITEWRTKFRREMNLRDNEMNSRAVDSLLNFETVKYYSASKYEIGRYHEAILKYQSSEWKSTASLAFLNMIQNFVVVIGLMAGSLLAAWAVVHGFNGMHLTVGDFVQFGTYLLQLYGPLNFLGTYYRMIQQAFIDMENMFDLLALGHEIEDSPEADDLKITDGKISFTNVSFHYEPEKPILKNISFTVPAGQTYALVGNSGGGKSTIIRLLFRFYDIQGGVIEIDGQDISLVKQESLRKAIGVVPQDTVLFNNDIRYNIRYGRVTAVNEEVEEAAVSADIHDRILSFPNGYNTVVGERGLKLSGGEKQRVAIARTLLKSPVIVLLDEATSALDTQTERNIQSSLHKVCENRTTIIVAHRLSTIIHANCILVLKEGEIIERGTHEELLSLNGMYTDLWLQQTTTEGDKEDRDIRD